MKDIRLPQCLLIHPVSKSNNVVYHDQWLWFLPLLLHQCIVSLISFNFVYIFISTENVPVCWSRARFHPEFDTIWSGASDRVWLTQGWSVSVLDWLNYWSNYASFDKNRGKYLLNIINKRKPKSILTYSKEQSREQSHLYKHGQTWLIECNWSVRLRWA